MVLHIYPISMRVWQYNCDTDQVLHPTACLGTSSRGTAPQLLGPLEALYASRSRKKWVVGTAAFPACIPVRSTRQHGILDRWLGTEIHRNWHAAES